MDVAVFYDYHCPYCRRALAWLDGLDDGQVRPRYRLFALEQVNRDPSAESWRLWEQPLDYAHYRGRQDRRPLAAFLVTALVEADEPPPVVRAFREAVYAARFDEGRDISDLALLVDLSTLAGADRERLSRSIDDPARDAVARDRIRDDWLAARSEYAIFGVPTLWLPGRAPIYLRLARPPGPAEGERLWERLIELTDAHPNLLELKVPDPIEAA